MSISETSLSALIYVEDPGAANYMQNVPAILQKMGLTVRLLIHEISAKYFPGNEFQLIPETYPSSLAQDTLQELDPDVLIVGTSENVNSFSFALTDAARDLGIVSLGMVDTYANYQFRFRGKSDNALTHATDYLAVADDQTKGAFQKLGLRPEKVFVFPHPRFSELLSLRSKWGQRERKEFRAKWFPEYCGPGPLMVFVSELSTGLDAAQFQKSAEYTLVGSAGSQGRTETVLDAFLDSLSMLPETPYLVLRLHPKQQPESLRGYTAYFKAVSMNEPALEIVFASDLVVGMTSVLLSEAAFLGCSVLSIVPRPDERIWLGDLADKIPCLSTNKALREFFSNQFDNWPTVPVQENTIDNSREILEHVVEKIQVGIEW